MPEPPPLLSDPALEIMPDYSHADYDHIRNVLAALLNNSQERAVETLEEAWQKEIDRKKAIWAAQEAARTNNEPANPPDNPPAPQQPDTDAPPIDKKKRPIISGTISNPRIDRPRPSIFAIQKLESFEYVELWYFTNEGCHDTLLSTCSTEEDTLGLVQGVDGLSLQKVAKGSKRATQDENLTWEQLSIAKGNFLYYIQFVVLWPDPTVAAFSSFYFNLDNHPIKAEPLGSETLLQYHAQVRRDWFSTFKHSASGETFDIATIDAVLLLTINARLTRAANHQERLLVSIPSSFFAFSPR